MSPTEHKEPAQRFTNSVILILMAAKPNQIVQISARTRVPAATLKRWKGEGCWPAGASALRPIDEFVEKCKQLRGIGRPKDVAILKLAGDGVTTRALGDVLIGLTCIPEDEPLDQSLGDPYQVVYEMRKREQGRRMFGRYSDVLSDESAEPEPTLDIGEERADHVMTAAVLAFNGKEVDHESKDDLNQLVHNQAARIVGVDPAEAGRMDESIADQLLVELSQLQRRMVPWLTQASLDEMTLAVRVAAQLDQVRLAIPGDRDDLGPEETWRGIGRTAVVVGAIGFDKLGTLFDDLRNRTLSLPS